MSPKFIFGYNLLVGVMDSLTGVLLMTAPAFTLGLMQIDHVPPEEVYLRFVGAFVLGTGLAYLLPHISLNHQQASVLFAWRYTSVVRSIVCVFVSVQCLFGTLEPAWMLVAITDGLLAILQMFLIARLRLSIRPSIASGVSR